MRKFVPWLVIALLVVVGVVFERRYDAQLEASRRQADALHQRAKVLQGVAYSWQMIAETHIQYAAELARQARTRDAVIRERVRTIAQAIAALPDTGVAARDTIIADQSAVIAEQQKNFETLEGAFAEQQKGTAMLQIANDSLNAAVDSLNKAFDLVRHPPRRSLFAVLLHPKIGPATFVGICTDKKPCAGAGVAAKWEF